ncbi:MAG: hypothetical protein WB502_06540, partial [Thermoactinomyces sp.]
EFDNQEVLDPLSEPCNPEVPDPLLELYNREAPDPLLVVYNPEVSDRVSHVPLRRMGKMAKITESTSSIK